jgi:hypothetical protein
VSAQAKSIPNVTIPKTTYRDLGVGSHLTVRLLDGSTRDAVVERIGPVDGRWAMLTLCVPGQQACYLPVSELELELS